jgi:hypothetical protein
MIESELENNWWKQAKRRKRKGQINYADMRYKYPQKLKEKVNPCRTIGFHS